MQRHHVKVTLDNNCLIFAGDRLPRLIQPKEQLPLVKNRGFWRVEILWLFVAEGATAKPHHPSLGIHNRDHQAIAKAVIVAVPCPPRDNQTGLFYQLRGIPFLLHKVGVEHLPTRRGIAQAKLLNRLLFEMALSLQIVLGGLANGLPQGMFIETGGDRQNLVELLLKGEPRLQACFCSLSRVRTGI